MTQHSRGETQFTRLGVGSVVTALLAIASALEFPALVVVVDNVLTAVASLTLAVVGLGISLFTVVFDSLLLFFALGGLLLFALHHG